MRNIQCLAMDFRKECRRDSKDCRCPAFNKDELIVCGVATVGELHVARNVYGIKVMATVAISSNACRGISGVEKLQDTRPLLGKVYKIPWHPRTIPELFISMPHEASRLIVKDMIERDYSPVISPILDLFNMQDISNV